MKRSLGIILLVLLTVGLLLPTAMASENDIVITYGETTYNNQDYKNIVDNFFSTEASIHEAMVKVITADEVNEVSAGITHKTYGPNQIFSSALLDLSESDELVVDVDTSKITVITAKMYFSALESAGITQGHVVVTSPVPSTGESALAGVMNCYEDATGVEIPEEVKEVANEEIQTETQIVENNNVTPDELSNVVDDVKEEVEENDMTQPEEVKQVINEVTNNYNIVLNVDDVDNLANVIAKEQTLQASAEQVESQLNDSIGQSQSFFDKILSFFGF
ncbi:MAG: DUF1002 domain-containing protein [Methanobacteriaceae archaeon]|nr:DUF1002 domain-containing protein [Methanobacteriaceae archaeon]